MAEFEIVRAVLLPGIKESYEPQYWRVIDLSDDVIERVAVPNADESGLRTLRQWVQSLVTRLSVADLEGGSIGGEARGHLCVVGGSVTGLLNRRREG